MIKLRSIWTFISSVKICYSKYPSRHDILKDAYKHLINLKKNITQLIFDLLTLIIIISLLFSGVSYNIVFSQALSKPQSKVTNSSSYHTNPLTIKVTSPAKGQEVPIGHPLTVAGISTDNVSSSCQVLVLLNDLKPYKQASPTGENGLTDYSTWKYTFAPKNGIIKDGPNRITAKVVCGGDSPTNLTKFYSVNFTGKSKSPLRILTTNNAIRYNGTTGVLLGAAAASATNVVLYNITAAEIARNQINVTKTLNQTGKQSSDVKLANISTSVLVANNPVKPGNNQTVVVTASDSKTNLKIYGASIDIWISNASGIATLFFSGITDHSGLVSHGWKIDGNSKPGDYVVTAEVFARGYKDRTDKSTFKISPR